MERLSGDRGCSCCGSCADMTRAVCLTLVHPSITDTGRPMSHRVQKRARRAARAAVVAATSLPAILICGVAAAEQTNAAAGAPQAPGVPTTTSQAPAAAGDLQEVVVTGFRASLQSALDAKRVSIQPIESVAAEDIGKMP